MYFVDASGLRLVLEHIQASQPVRAFIVAVQVIIIIIISFLFIIPIVFIVNLTRRPTSFPALPTSQGRWARVSEAFTRFKFDGLSGLI